MTTYNAIQFSANKIATDLKLFFEIHDHDNLYCTDPDFKEKWGKHIKSLVAERLWGYAEAVFDKELGWEKFEIDGVEQTLSNALTRFGSVCEEVKMYWMDGAWVEQGEDEEPCYNCGVMFVLNSNTVGCVCDDCDNNDDDKDDGPMPCYDCCEPTEDEDLITIEGRGGVCKDCLRGDRYKNVEYEGKEENDNRMECEECDELFPSDDLDQSDSRFLCEDCFKDVGCCENCGEEPYDDDPRFTNASLMTLCKDCYLDELAEVEIAIIGEDDDEEKDA